MSLIDLDIPTARVFRPLLEPARYKGAHGGRGSGKSHFFAEAAVEHCVMHPGARIACVREIQKDLRESAKMLIEDKIKALGALGFNITKDFIGSPGGGVIIFKGMRDYNAESIKSLEGFDVAWTEEASSLSARSLQLLRPTIRKPGSELWFSWNPRRKSDAVDALLRGPGRPDRAAVVAANWSDNPWFPAELEAERQHDLKHSPAYRHIWEGDYATVVDGAYYAIQLQAAQNEGRITPLSYDPILDRRAYWDLGYNDATAIWIAQFRGQQVHVLDYIEATGQELGFYIDQLRSRGHERALCCLPHDGGQHHVAKSAEELLKDAGFRTKIVPNQGRGAAMARVEAARRLFPRIWFDEQRCAPGLEALGAYHERRDDARQIGHGPEHDWASHGADAFGLMCVDWTPPRVSIAQTAEVMTLPPGETSTGWMAA